MKLRNKKTGKVLKMDIHCIGGKVYESLAEINKEWEDYEEPKTYYYISDFGAIREGDVGKFVEDEISRKEIGNYFETKEEAEKAVEKLKAWKRLKDDGLKIKKYELNGGTDRNRCFTGDICFTLDITKPVYEDVIQLLFGGE